MSQLMISVSGIRGVFGESLTPEIAMKFAARFGVFQNRGKIVVGRDSRTTGPAMFHSIVAGLLSVGCDVVDIGIASTPTVLLAVEHSDAAGGIAITASHNPAQWNAMKLVDGNGLFLFPEKAAEFLKTLDLPVEFASWDKMGILTHDTEATRRHIDKILAIPYLDLNAIRGRRFRVVVDCVNGAGGVIAPHILRELGCEVIELNGEPTGRFAHTPEPLNENLVQLEQAVKTHRADLGFAVDPDVDRLALVDGTGSAIGEEYSLLLAELYILSKRPGDIVTNLSSSMASDDIAARYNVAVHRTKVGEINVGKKMLETGATVGGEGNGGIICPEVHLTRDAPVGMALILGLLAETGKSLSDLIATIPRYYFAKGKMELEPEKMAGIMDKVESRYSNLSLDKTDGIKIIGDKHWVHIRKSGTEPILRVYVESESEERSQNICRETIETIKSL